MKTKVIIAVMAIMCLIPTSYAFSADDTTVEGEVGITGIGFTGGNAKFTEYKDLVDHNAFFGRARLNVDTNKYFLNFNAGDFAYNTQYYDVEGGMWGRFKFDLYYDEVPHNITFDARTPFSGAGTNTLTGTPNTNVGAWNTFDYSIVRHQYGTDFKFDLARPFFFDVSFDRENREGIKPTGAAVTSPGGSAFELPLPIDYKTNNLKLSAGYAEKPLFLSFDWIYNDFSNCNPALNLPASFNVAGAPTPATVFSLPPDNTFSKGVLKGAISLPFNTKISTNLGLSRGTSQADISAVIGSFFTGRVETQNYDFFLTSNPIRFLDVKAYYKDYRRHNESDDPSGIANIFLDYSTVTAGGELGLRLPEKFYLSGGYKYSKIEQDMKGETDPLLVLPYNRDNTYFVNLKWTGLDFLEARVGYEKLDRTATYLTPQSAVDPAQQFAYAAQRRDTVKAAVDIFPLDKLDLGVEYKYKNANYLDTSYGLKNDEEHQVDISASYMIGKIAKVYGYGDVGMIKYNQLQFEGTTLLPWQADQWEMTWGYGLGAEVYVIPKKLTLIFQHDYERSSGTVDFTLNPGLFISAVGLGGIGASNNNVDIGDWDNYQLYSFKVRAIYNFTKSLTASIGYAYERFNYSDAQLNNYNYVPTGVATNSAFLTGAYAGQSYSANIIFMGLSYKF
jgi:MtrB/PioB family decaheme-associated outer membrane protein